ncbi:phosphoglycerate dehydrogenase [Candidatus Bathyarchaeota archaeon]|nr:phosphoglycerate dehydrogenase [Candidatus Bathyarchaeota archaeon]
MKKRVLITEPLPMYDVAVDLLQAYAEVEVSEVFYDIVPAEKIRGCRAIIVGDSKISEQSLSEADDLLLVQKFGVGVDTIDLDACSKRGIYVCNLPGVNAIDVAEYVVGAMISYLRRFMRMDEAARRAAWDERPNLIGERLSGKTVGIIGFGNIGRNVARLLEPFKVRVLVYDPYVDMETKKKLGVADSDLSTLLRESDIVTLHVPLTEETRGLIGYDELKSMKSSAILINAARGGIVDEDALYKALSEGVIRGAVIDVYAEEPPQKDNPLLRLENVQLSLHTASWTREVFEEMMRLCSMNVISVLEGAKPKNIVNLEALKRRV